MYFIVELRRYFFILKKEDEKSSKGCANKYQRYADD